MSLIFFPYFSTKESVARDRFHELVRELLEAEGWEITHDPLFVKTALATVEIDLGAEKVLGAEKEGVKIAVEVKSFIGHSKLQDLYKALGQYGYYLPALRRQEPDRKLFLAIPQSAFEFFFQDPIAEELVETYQLRFLVYSTKKHSIVAWKE